MSDKFRDMRRAKQQMTDEQCRELLKSEVHGTLAVVGDNGYPYAVPLHFAYDAQHNVVLLHGAREGHKIDAIKNNDKACFTVYNDSAPEEHDKRRYYYSVVIFGRVRLVEDEDEKMKTAYDLCAKFETPQEVDEHLAREAATVQMVVLDIEHMAGKRIRAQDDLPLYRRKFDI